MDKLKYHTARNHPDAQSGHLVKEEPCDSDNEIFSDGVIRNPHVPSIRQPAGWSPQVSIQELGTGRVFPHRPEDVQWTVDVGLMASLRKKDGRGGEWWGHDVRKSFNIGPF